MRCRRLGALLSLLAAGCVGAAQPAAGPGAPRFPSTWSFDAASAAPVRARGGMVVTTDPVASEIGAEILRRGGNAVDAAVAVHFALAVVNPEAGNLGGGGFLLLRWRDGRTAALDFRETAPRRATPAMFLDSAGRPTDRSLVGHLAAGVPGSVMGMWEAHRRFGARPWAELLQPAIALAEGIVVHRRLAESLQAHAERLRRYPQTAAIFLPGGRPPRVGERFVQHDLAETLRRIAAEGPDDFYRGRTAALIEREMRRGGGLIDREDLARYRAVWREPIRFTYRGFTVLSMPPPSSGGVTLALLLQMLEGDDLRSLGWHSSAHLHLWAEAAKRAFADRNALLGDPDFVPVPVERLVSKAYAAARRRTIGARATPAAAVAPGLPVPEGEHTTHYSIVDAEGNAVAVTTTINSLYGNLVVVEGAGFLLNNEMDDFAAAPGVPNQFGLVQGAANAVAPGKRPLSAMTPTIVLDSAGRVRLVTGSPGGPTIISTVAQIVSAVVDFRMDLSTAVAAPRVHHQHRPDTLWVERGGLAPTTAAALRARGHAVVERGGYQGDAASILLQPDGLRVGVADPRRGGRAAGTDVGTGTFAVRP